MKIALELAERPAARVAGWVRRARLARRATIIRSSWILYLTTGAVTFGWLLLALVSSRINLAFLDPGGIYTERWLIGVIVLSVALALLGYSRAARKPHVGWMALGLVLHAAGSTYFAEASARLADGIAMQTGLYGLLLTRGAMVGLAAVGFLSARAPVLSLPRALAILAAYLVLLAGIVAFAGDLPSLASFDRLPREPDVGVTPGFTAFYWLAASAVSCVAAVTTVMACRRHPAWNFDCWIPVATIVMGAAAVHTVFRPSLFGISTELTSANTLMTLLCIQVILCCIFSLQVIAGEIATERDALEVETRRLADLERLRADFTTMVAHELSQPLLAIRRTAELLQSSNLPLAQQQAMSSIATEATTLFDLIDDVRASAGVDSEDFTLDIVRTDVGQIIARARAFAGSMPGRHPTLFEQRVAGEVWADPDRIGQVLRNLLTNADRYTPPTAAITVRAIPIGSSTLRIEVEDDGPGIDQQTLGRIFQKYERGGTDEPGLGVGLYLSRRILRGCGGDLQYRQGTRGGACFWFDLPRSSGRTGNLAPPG